MTAKTIWQKTKPVPKVAAGGAAALLVTVLIWAADLAFGYTLTLEVATALVGLVFFVAAWLKPDGSA